jgi:hypothetical protein
MRRLFRHIFTICSAGSLLLGIVLCAFWLDTAMHRQSRVAFFGPRERSVAFGADNGAFFVYAGDLRHAVLVASARTGQFVDHRWPGLMYRVVTGPGRSHDLWVMPPLAVGAAALLPICWAAPKLSTARRRRQRRALGQCLRCGYDLRAHAPGDRCPECGAAAQP